MYGVIIVVPVHFSRFFRVKPTVRWILDPSKFQTPFFSGQSLLSSITVLNDYYVGKTVPTDNFQGIEYPNIIKIDYNINYSYLYRNKNTLGVKKCKVNQKQQFNE